jgi:hypothetical protein
LAQIAALQWTDRRDASGLINDNTALVPQRREEIEL